MLINLKNILTSNPVLKVVSFLLGFFLWYVMSAQRNISLQIMVPLCIQNSSDHVLINSPEEIRIYIAGNRTDVYNLDRQNLAFHLDAHELHEGTNLIAVTAERLFLPPSIKLINYSPLVVKALVTNNPPKDLIACAT